MNDSHNLGGDTPVRGEVLLTHDVGLHARPSVTLTKLAKRFQCRIDIGLSEQGPWVDAKSIAKVMKMKAPQDSILHFQAEGTDAEVAVKALVGLVELDFPSDYRGVLQDDLEGGANR